MNNSDLPRHVSIIMDGNGRWARLQGKERLFGHTAGRDSVRACSEYAAEIGIEYLSLFAFSEENWNRPQDEISGLMTLMARSVLDERPTFKKNNIRFVVLGDRSKLSDALLVEIDEAMEETAGNTGLTLIIFLSYSGKWDILQACQKYSDAALEAARKGEHFDSVTKASFEQYLCTAGVPDPDLLIRTSGEERISNYLLWQCAYSEFYFTNTLWPDFRKNEFALAIESYKSRQRRFGLTGEQMNK